MATEAISQGYKQTELGVIPEDWDVKAIVEISEIRGRVGWKGYTKRDLRSDGPYTLGAKHINTDNKLDLSEPTHLSREKYLESPDIMIKKRDILIVQRGTIGKLVLIDEDIGDATINPSMIILRAKNFNPEFVYYFLVSSKGQKQILLDTTSTGVPMITQKQIGTFKVPYPKSKEQSIIASVLSDTDILIEQLDKLIEKKKNIKQGAMQELLTGKRRLPGFKGEWEIKKLGDIVEIRKGQLITGDTRLDGDIPVIAGGKTPAYYHNKPNRIKKTITVSASGAYAGYVAFHKYPIFASDCSTIEESNNYSVEYIHFQLQRLQAIIYNLQTGGAQPHIHPSDLQPLEIFYTKYKAEQSAISQVLSDIDLEIEELEQKRDKYLNLKAGMMQQLLTGRIRLKC